MNEEYLVNRRPGMNAVKFMEKRYTCDKSQLFYYVIYCSILSRMLNLQSQTTKMKPNVSNTVLLKKYWYSEINECSVSLSHWTQCCSLLRQMHANMSA